MKRIMSKCGGFGIVLVVILCMWVLHAQAAIDGIGGTTFQFTAKEGHVSSPDTASIYTWGYASGTGPLAGIMQYPGPTLILQEGAAVTITLKNELPGQAGNVSMLFPGHQVTATGGVAGLLTREAPPDGTTTVTYTFTASEPGTYTYYSGTNPDLQVEMGLVGAIIVRSGTPNWAYNHADTEYDYEYLFLLTEMDLQIHQQAEFGQWDLIDTTTFFPVYWFINGRNAPDTMLPAFVPWLPHQPYNSLPRMHPGDKLLIRLIGAGRDLHPFHHHGNNATIIARDGRLLSSAPGAGPDLAVSHFTLTTAPGQTMDAIFEWTGAKLGWDIYGHSTEDDLEPNEYAPDHGKPFPVTLPEQQELTFGGMYSGSPFLGVADALPPGEGGLNRFGGYFFMWHSHNEKEMTNNDIFPGGLMTQCIVEPIGVDIPVSTIP
jgi:FtsP/CotA-like multicopper oxidase with cupredoxin domain